MTAACPYCHNRRPVNNQIPDWNDLVYRGDWQEAAQNLIPPTIFSGIHRTGLPGACELPARSISTTIR